MRKYLAYFENEWPANITELTAVENKPFVGYLKGEGVKYTVIPQPVTGPADNEIWYTSSDNNKLTWWALNYVPTEQTATFGGDDEEVDVFYTPGDPGYERIYGYDVLYHDFDNDKNCFVLKFDKPLTETFWKFGSQNGANATIVACGQNITSFILPNSVNYILDLAFYGCSSLTSVTIPNSVTSIGNDAFSGCTSLTSVTIHNSVTSIGGYAFKDCSSLTSITIPDSVISIGDWAFDGTGIYNEESNWENDVLYIDNCLIEARTSISGAYAIKENTRLIADYALNRCSSLTSITIPNSVTSIGKGAFNRCSTLTSITIPNSVTSIGSMAFAMCSLLTSITVPNSVTSIGDWAFEGCSSIISIIIGNSVMSIGYGAFMNCSSLTSVTFEGTMEEWNSITKGNHWNSKVPATYVQCTDGQVTL